MLQGEVLGCHVLLLFYLEAICLPVLKRLVHISSPLAATTLGAMATKIFVQATSFAK